MYKNQLQELAQRSCFNLPSYSCIREGPDHAPRFKAAVNFNGEIFESPNFCTTLRQAEHSAAEVALNSLANRGPSHSLAARILDETGVYKNLLQEIAQRVGAALPVYTTFRSGLGHLPVFTGKVELAGIIFTGEPAKNKKQAEKNAAMAAWSSLKQLAQQTASSSAETETNDEQEQITIARALLKYRQEEKLAMATANKPNALPFPKKFPTQDQRPSVSQTPSSATGSKILPLIRPKSASRNRLASPTTTSDRHPSSPKLPENRGPWQQKFPMAGASPYVPFQHYQAPYHGMAPPVTIRTAVPVYSAPPLPPPPCRSSHIMAQAMHAAPPVRIRPVVPVFAAPPPMVRIQPPVHSSPPLPTKPSAQIEEIASTTAVKDAQESSAIESMTQLKI
ncbi:double-stranded RNA-binding protein 6 [Magnolia sinica]|uniref:double-stranded RNA-binding protein 6 n=1 Tax=Magnolia sinica TaxID=86752 RepID=UPI002659E6EC|nr:double-stranded RNA-binding protein 6 [Magnolia sinica]